MLRWKTFTSVKAIKNSQLPVRSEVRPRQAAEMIGCSVGYVYALMADGQLKSRSLTRRNKERGIRFVSVASIEAFLKGGV